MAWRSRRAAHGTRSNPIADFLCTHCMAHRRVTGRALVTDYLRSQPIEQHRDMCPARKDNP